MDAIPDRHARWATILGNACCASGGLGGLCDVGVCHPLWFVLQKCVRLLELHRFESVDVLFAAFLTDGGRIRVCPVTFQTILSAYCEKRRFCWRLALSVAMEAQRGTE